jgi:hypothetical protein
MAARKGLASGVRGANCAKGLVAASVVAVTAVAVVMAVFRGVSHPMLEWHECNDV